MDNTKIDLERLICSCQGATADLKESDCEAKAEASSKQDNEAFQITKFTLCGGNGLGVPPVPIPNTEVKP